MDLKPGEHAHHFLFGGNICFLSGAKAASLRARNSTLPPRRCQRCPPRRNLSPSPVDARDATLPHPNRFDKSSFLTNGLPGGGSRNGPSCVHQNAPAVARGLVALDCFVKSPGPTVGDEDGLARMQPSIVQRALSLLVTRGNFL